MLLMSIAAMAVDPTVIAVCGSIGGGLLLKGAETVMSKRKVDRDAFDSLSRDDVETARIEGLAKAILEDDSFGGCTLEFQRAFEQKFIDAGIPTTLSKCYDERCETCHPPMPPMDAKERMANRRLPGHSLPIKPPASSAKLKKMKEDARKSYEKSRSGKQRVAEVSGRVVPIPHNVPNFATGALYYDSGRLDPFIGWKWRDGDESHGPVRSYRQNISKEMFNTFPLAGKREPFTTKGGAQKIVCRRCNDAYYIRPGQTPTHIFTCKGCQTPKPPTGKGGGSPAKNLHDTLKAEHEAYKQQIKAEQYKIDEFKKEIQYLNEQMHKANRIGWENYNK